MYVLFDTSGIAQGIAAHRAFYRDGNIARLVDQTIEEMSELTQALLKDRRYSNAKERIRDEFSDVLICLEFLGRELGFTENEMRSAVSQKAVRLGDLLEANRK